MKMTPSEYYRTGFVDMMHAIEGFYDGDIAEMNKLRHQIAAPVWAMGGKVDVKQLMPLPTDKAEKAVSSMTKEQFLALAKKYKA